MSTQWMFVHQPPSHMNVSELIKKYLNDNNISQRRLSTMLGETAQNFNKKLSKDDLLISLVERISIAVQHDFFGDISRSIQKKQPGLRQLPNNIPYPDVMDLLFENRELNKRIRVLEEELRKFTS